MCFLREAYEELTVSEEAADWAEREGQPRAGWARERFLPGSWKNRVFSLTTG